MEKLDGKHPFIVAGPCSAESPAQLSSVAAALAGRADYFRAGLWKPRTRPGSFEGVGEKGLPWLAAVRKEHGLRVCTEVAGARHVSACLEAGTDAVWIGARTTANPFLMQEIADSLSGSAIPVMLKNPVNSDISLWTGAVERLARAGVSGIMLIHRGFSTSENIEYRNAPCWNIAFQMRSRFPELPFLCDPSHMGGRADLVPGIAQKALDLGYDGLMVEVHPDPASALSDPDQQLTPETFISLLDRLEVRSNSGDRDFLSQVESLRARIDSIDSSLVTMLAERMELSRRIGECKRRSNVAILQPGRWDSVLRTVRQEARECGLDSDFVTRIFNDIHEASVAEQNNISSKKL